MKRVWRFLLPGILLACLLAAACASAETAPAGTQDEWTVLFYFCGSDLESKYGYASENLKDINAVYSLSGLLQQQEAGRGGVNILVETGGSKEWKTEEAVGMKVDAGAIQRWRLASSAIGLEELKRSIEAERPESRFQLMETLPLQSMAKPETLADFIRWGVQTCPAKKYALVLWDHGFGAKSGLLADKLFDGDILYLYELRQALESANVQFEDIIIDACLMANIETAWNLRNHAKWMVASEEVVPGNGTAIGKWLQALVSYPEMDGEWLGRCICDMNGIKYATNEDPMARSLMTWSVTDLGKIDRLVQAEEKIFHAIGESAAGDKLRIRSYAVLLNRLEEYGEGRQCMRDFGSLLYNEILPEIMENGIIREAMQALQEAEVYVSHGPGRSEARGLTFWYPHTPEAEDLEIYVKNYPMPEYLAFLDAITAGWTAPDWVYEKTARLPEMSTLAEFGMTVERVLDANGFPAMDFGDSLSNVNRVVYNLYKKDEVTGDTLWLGQNSCRYAAGENGRELVRAGNITMWPSIEGNPCCISLVQDRVVTRLYNILVEINGVPSVLRCGRSTAFSAGWEETQSEYQVYGVWEGYDEHTEMMNRSVQPLAMVAGRDFCILYLKDIQDAAGRVDMVPGETMRMSRGIDVTEAPLPAGTYYLEYTAEGLFHDPLKLERIEFRWDGKEMTFAEGFTWTGATASGRK